MRFCTAALGVACVLVVAGQAFAGSVTVVSDPGTLQNTAALTGFATKGDMMVGMKVTAFFSDSSSEYAIWAADGPGNGKATGGTGWWLAEVGDTFGGRWTLQNPNFLGMTRLLIDAGVGDTVFDRTSPSPGTAGSGSGWDFAVVSGTGDDRLDILATYRDAVGVAGNAPVGDLFRRLDIEFIGGTGYRSSVSSYMDLVFIADTDNLKFAGDITPVVPEPLTMLSSFLAVGALGGYIRRRRLA
jgi:hypothetical protein